MADGFLHARECPHCGAKQTRSRLITLSEARTYLRGKHPVELGVHPVGFLSGDAARPRRGSLYDQRAIDAKLDEQAGLSPPRLPARTGNDADDVDELKALAARIGVDAPRRP